MNKNKRTYILLVVLAACALGFIWHTLSKKKTTQQQSVIATQPAPDVQERAEQQPEGQPVSKIITTPSGLSFIVLTEPAEGAASPRVGNSVHVHYTGWLADENGSPITTKKFDSSVDRGQPFIFRVGTGQVIKGWDEGVMDMKVGEKRQFILPPHLGYGTRGAGGLIPGNATLVFDVELLKV